MNSEKTIEAAIARSVSHTEIVQVVVPDLFAAYEEAREVSGAAAHNLSAECGFSIENDGSYDVYGTTEVGDHFRLRLVHG